MPLHIVDPACIVAVSQNRVRSDDTEKVSRVRGLDWRAAVQMSVVVAIVVLLAATSSGALPFSTPGQPALAGAASAWRDPADGAQQLPGDNMELCSPRRGPSVRTSVDPSGSLRVTIRSATGFDGFPIALRRLRIGPTQNAAVTIGPHVGRTDAFFYDLIGVQEVSFTASRAAPGQSLHIPLIVYDDCEEWNTFAGAGPGVALPAVVPTATAIPCPPGQACGSIPIGMRISPSRTFGPGTRVQMIIETRPQATCELRVTYPGRSAQSLGVRTTDANGDCLYDLFVPFDVSLGNGSFVGIVQDAFGTNVRVVPFTIGSDDGENDAGFSDFGFAADNQNENGNENEADNDE